MEVAAYSAPVGSFVEGAFQAVTVTASPTANSYSLLEAIAQVSGGSPGLNAGQPLMTRISRLGTDASDTHPGSVELLGTLYSMVGSE